MGTLIRMGACAGMVCCIGLTLTTPSYSETGPEGGGTGTTVITVTTDWATGGLTALSTESPEHPRLDLTSICPDAIARSYDGNLYVINRFGCGSIQVIDPAADFHTVREFSTGPRSNPQDIAFVSPQRAFVSRYDSNLLLEIDVEKGTVTDSVDLSEFADDDGLSEMYTMEFVAPYLYISLQRLNRRDFQPSNTSMIAVVDTRRNEIVDTNPATPELNAIELRGRNPFGRMRVQNDGKSKRLLVATAGTFGVETDGGLESIDLSSWETEGFVIEGGQLGGDLLDFATDSPSRIFAIVADESNVTSVVVFNPLADSDPTVIARSRVPAGQGSAYHFFDCLLTESGQLWVADRHPEVPGIRIFDSETGVEQTRVPISTGLPPFALLELRMPSEPAVPLPAPVVVYPNPTSSNVTFAITGASGRIGRIFDAHGRHVRTLNAATKEGLAFWDGDDSFGHRSRSGRYWIVISTKDGRSLTQSIQVLR